MLDISRYLAQYALGSTISRRSLEGCVIEEAHQVLQSRRNRERGVRINMIRALKHGREESESLRSGATCNPRAQASGSIYKMDNNYLD